MNAILKKEQSLVKNANFSHAYYFLNHIAHDIAKNNHTLTNSLPLTLQPVMVIWDFNNLSLIQGLCCSL